MTLPLFDDEPETVVELPMPARRYGILVTGPNASGKTTAVREALAPWAGDRRVRAFHPDHERNKDKIAEIEFEVLAVWETAATVVVVEATNRAATATYRVVDRYPDMRVFEALVLSMEPETMRLNMQRRCAKRHKAYREDYWSEQTLRYEGLGRYRNMADAHFKNVATHLTIDSDYVATQAVVAHLRARVSACLA